MLRRDGGSRRIPARWAGAMPVRSIASLQPGYVVDIEQAILIPPVAAAGLVAGRLVPAGLPVPPGRRAEPFL